MSALNHVNLKLHLDESADHTLEGQWETNDSVSIDVYGINYNVLKITGGMGRLQY